MTTGLIGGGSTARSPLAQLAAVATLVASVLACYLPTPGDYWISYDNPQLIRLEPRIRALTLEGSARTAALKVLVTTPHHDLYQPLASFSWAIDHALFGWNRAGFHAHSLALHVLVVVALFFLALRLCGSVLAAFLAALLCAVHPAMVQSVCWTISRTSSLAAIWILIGSHLQLSYVRHPGRHSLLALATIAFAISMTAKALPSVILVPILLNLWVARPVRTAVWLESLPLAVVAGILIVANLQASNSFAGETSIVRPWLEVLAKAPESLGLAVANTVWPRGLALHYDYETAGSLIGWRWLAVAGACLVATVAGKALWRRGERGVLLSAAAFVALLAPQIAAMRYRDILTADRYLYVPLLFLALGLASALARVFGDRVQPRGLRRPGAIALALVAAVGLSVQTRADSRMWTDEEQLWQRVVSQTPAPFPYLALCKLYAREARATDAADACERAHELALQDRYASKDPVFAFNLAQKARIAGSEWKASTRPEASRTASHYLAMASSAAAQGIASWPERVDLRYELGRSQLASGEAGRALSTFEALLAQNPDDEPSITYLAIALVETGDLARARTILEANLAAGRVEPIRYRTLAGIYSVEARHDLAASANLAWLEADPESTAAHLAFHTSLRAAEQADPQGEADNARDELAVMRDFHRRRYPEEPHNSTAERPDR